MKIFLSFSFKYQDHAAALAKAVRSLEGVDEVFLSSDTLVAGQRWQNELQEKINGADAFVFLLGEHVGNWQRIEFEDAFDRKVAEDADRDRKGEPLLPLVPVVFEKNAPATLLRRDRTGLPFVQRVHLIVDPDAFARHGNGFEASPSALVLIESALVGEGSAATQLWRTLNPYRGLLALREQDADFLFGRDDEVAEFVGAISEQPGKVLLALGASGVGKSSLVFAGVFAALERKALPSGDPWPASLADCRLWPRLSLTPGAEPLRSLAGGFLSQWLDTTTRYYRKETGDWQDDLADGDSIDGLVNAADAAIAEQVGDPPARYLLYVDQGEELYTRAGRDPSRDGTKRESDLQRRARRFSELLAEAARHPRLVVLMSARSDFLDRLQADKPIFGNHHKLDVTPLDEAALKDVVGRPAMLLGVKFEEGLDNALVASAREQNGGLPLLSDTLDVLWKEMRPRGDGVLRWTARADQAVNVARKLADRADAFVSSRQDQLAEIRRLFCVRLAFVPRQGAPTRQTFFLDDDDVASSELELVNELAAPDQRILSTGERDGRPFAEVAHEALLTSWDRLNSWIEDRREFYAWVTQVANDRKEWEVRGKKKSYLLTGRPLVRAQGFLETDEADVHATDAEFINESASSKEKSDRAQRRRERQRIAAEARAEHQRLENERLLAENRASEERERAARAELARKAAEASQVTERAGRLAAELEAQQKAAEASKAQRKILVRTRLATGVVLALLAVVAAVAVFAFQQERLAAEQERVAGRFARLTLLAQSENARFRAGRSVDLANQGNEGAAIAVALSAMPQANSDGWPEISSIHEVPNALYSAILGFRGHYVLRGHERTVGDVVYSPDGTRIATASDDFTARLWDGGSAAQIAVLRGHQGDVNTASFSPDGSQLATASNDGTVRIWDGTTGVEQRVLRAQSGIVRDIAFSPDGVLLAAAYDDGSARLWKASSGRLTLVLNDHSATVQAIAFSPDGAWLATGSHDGTAKLWDSRTGIGIAVLDGHSNVVHDVSFSPDGSQLATASWDTTTVLWNTSTGNEIVRLEGHTGLVRKVVFSPDGQFLATASDDESARLWNAATGESAAVLDEHSRKVYDVEFSSDGKLIATGSRDNTARIWDVSSGGEIAILGGHRDRIYAVDFSPDGKHIVTASRDRTARVWSIDSTATAKTLRLHSHWVNAVDYSPDGTKIVTASDDGTARIWGTADGTLIVSLEGHDDEVNMAVFSGDGERVATASWDSTAGLWEGRTGEQIALLTGHSDRVVDVAFSKDGSQLATASSDGTARIWDGRTGAGIAILEGHSGTIHDVKYAPKGNLIATASADGTARLWNAAQVDEATFVLVHDGEVNSVAFSPDGRMLATTSDDRTARLWDVQSGLELERFGGHENSVEDVVFSPDGKQLATSSFDRTIRLWSVDSETDVIILKGHTESVYAVSYSPDGERVATASRDGTARLWSAVTGREYFAYDAHSDRVYDVEFSPDGNWLATASRDSTARIWRYYASYDDLYNTGVEIVERLQPLTKEEECELYLRTGDCES